MSTNEFPRGMLNSAILYTMINNDKYGYEIIEEIKLKTGIEIKQPSLYSSLKRMEAQRLVNSYWKDSSIGGKRHYYCLTAQGKKFLEDNPFNYSIKTNTNYNDTNQSIELNNVNNKVIEDSQNKENNYQFAQQENIFDINKEYKTAKEKSINESEDKNNISSQFTLFSQEENNKDDGKFITETLEDYEIPKSHRYEPASLNIESRDTSYLNAKLNNKQNNKTEQKNKPYQEKMTDLLITKLTLPYNHEKSMEKINNKINKFEEKRKQKEVFTDNKFEQIGRNNASKKALIDDQESNIITNKQSTRIFNSYNGLESFFVSKNIGFKQYHSKEIANNYYVNPALVNLINCLIFFILSFTLSLGFYCGLSNNSLGEIIYLIVPILSFLTFLFLFYVLKRDKNKNIIQMKNETTTLLLPMIAVAIILIIIAINLIIGFDSNNTIKYFPILIYPIILSCYFGLIPYINKFLNITIRFLRKKFKYRF